MAIIRPGVFTDIGHGFTTVGKRAWEEQKLTNADYENLLKNKEKEETYDIMGIGSPYVSRGYPRYGTYEFQQEYLHEFVPEPRIDTTAIAQQLVQRLRETTVHFTDQTNNEETRHALRHHIADYLRGNGDVREITIDQDGNATVNIEYTAPIDRINMTVTLE